MLRTETVSAELLSVLNELMRMESLKKFRLVGGTALSLQLGHRKSIDIDLFSFNEYPVKEILKEMMEKFEGSLQNIEDNEVMIKAQVNGIKIDIVRVNDA